MGKLLIAGLMLATSSSAVLADSYVRGYYRSNGTYVQPHYQSPRDGIYNNNWSVRPNVNPYTGQMGHKAPRSDGWSSGSTYGGSGLGGYGSYGSHKRCSGLYC
jgi:hypothetical protein